MDANGWQMCDGATIAAGATLGGSPSTVPNLTDNRFLAGTTLGGTTGTTGGANSVTLAVNQIPAGVASSLSIGSTTVTGNKSQFDSNQSNPGNHAHTMPLAGGNPATNGYPYSVDGGAYQKGSNATASDGGSHTHSWTSTFTASGTPTGTGSTTNASQSSVSTVPQYITVKYLIRVK
jgi:hypothetical protein